MVSDGSTDRTTERARHYEGQIKVLIFEHNRGYGAAIQEAWQESGVDLLGFLDADGTCEPQFFADLANALETHKPFIRQTGNLLFAALLSVLSGKHIRDTASGMRIVRRSAYQKLRPLPDGLHFTPAMSARAQVDRESDLKLIEIDMPYHERTGESKLKVGKDGIRFLKIILKTAAIYRPLRLASVTAAGSLMMVLAAASVLRRMKTTSGR